ncbi:MAG: hypothetical protein HYR96_00890 [Deltaproteobacteria bacterium]|nr:hypothetical protein [Deltaproteobacteria bacterium]MBI3296076.1 hypothetical protein [Deltaproteobacteria bacterium]
MFSRGTTFALFIAMTQFTFRSLLIAGALLIFTWHSEAIACRDYEDCVRETKEAYNRLSERDKWLTKGGSRSYKNVQTIHHWLVYFTGPGGIHDFLLSDRFPGGGGQPFPIPDQAAPGFSTRYFAAPGAGFYTSKSDYTDVCSIEIHQCALRSNGRHFVSNRSDCEGQQEVRFLGYLCKAEAGGTRDQARSGDLEALPLYRTYSRSEDTYALAGLSTPPLLECSGGGLFQSCRNLDYEPQMLLGYVLNGRKSGEVVNGCKAEDFHPRVFDWKAYLYFNSDLPRANITTESAAKIHWIRYGMNEGRRGSMQFHSKDYLRRYQDVADVFGKNNYRGAITHFLKYGFDEGRDGGFRPSPNISETPLLLYAQHSSTRSGKIELGIKFHDPNEDYSPGRVDRIFRTPKSDMRFQIPFPANDKNIQVEFADWDKDAIPDAYVLLKHSTGSGKVEVHGLSGKSSFQSFNMHLATSMAAVPDSAEFQLVDWDKDGSKDLAVLVRGPKNMSQLTINILSAASGFKTQIMNAVISANNLRTGSALSLYDYDSDGMEDLLIASNVSLDGMTHAQILSGFPLSSCTPSSRFCQIREIILSGRDFKTVLSETSVQSSGTTAAIKPIFSESFYNSKRYVSYYYYLTRIDTASKSVLNQTAVFDSRGYFTVDYFLGDIPCRLENCWITRY